MGNINLNKNQWHIILAITFGNILEWYQVYSYVYLTPILAKKFFNFPSAQSNLFMAFIIFGIGFLTRPIGGFLFGRWGDIFGRKNAFIWSIFIITMPTFLMGCLPTYAQWGMWSSICLIVLRFIQSLPESGESPGSFCFLYENADASNKKFMCSWGAFGNQIGAIIGIFESLVVDQFMSEDFLLSWGWRISFWVGSSIGLLGFILRKTLDETPIFKNLQEHHKTNHFTALSIIRKYKWKILLGAGFGLVNAATFYLIATYLPSYFNKIIGLQTRTNAFISLSITSLITLLLPIFGVLANKFKVKNLMISSNLMIIFLLPFLYYFINARMVNFVFFIAYLYVIPIACITAFIPYVLLRLFPAPVRFTGVALAFNLADGIIGGFTPATAILLAHYTGSQGAFCWFLLACALISLMTYFKIKD